MSVQLDVAALLARHPLEWSVEDQGLVYEETVGLSYVGHVDDIVPALATALRAALADQRRFDWLESQTFADVGRMNRDSSWRLDCMGISGEVRGASVRSTIDQAIADAALTADGGGV